MFIKKFLLAKCKKEIFLLFFTIICWFLFTLTNSQMQYFHKDELWSMSIASSLNFFDIIKLMHYEGHTFLWYMILKPFLHFFPNHLFIVKHINYLFLSAAMCLFWFKSPINTYIKILITLSAPMLTIYPFTGRPYGLGILLLFLLIYFYKFRLKHYILYSLLLFLALNTHILVTIGAAAFGLLFLYDVVEENKKCLLCKKIVIVFSFAILALLSLCIQWVPLHIPSYAIYFNKTEILVRSLSMSKYPNIIIALICFYIMVVYFIFMKYAWNIRWIIFSFFIYANLFVLFFFFYPAWSQHAKFLYIYLIVLYWLFIENHERFIKQKQVFCSFSLMVIMVSILSLSYFNSCKYGLISNTNYYKVRNDILQKIPAGSTIYIDTVFYDPIIEKIYDVKNQKKGCGYDFYGVISKSNNISKPSKKEFYYVKINHDIGEILSISKIKN